MRQYIYYINISILLLSGFVLHSQKPNQKSLRRPASLDNEQIQRIYESLKQYRQYGLLAQNDGDMGDTLQRTGSYYSMLHYLGVEKDDQGRPLELGFQSDVDNLMVEPGYYRRSNRMYDWSSNPENCSRDQMLSLNAAIVIYRDFNRGRDLFKKFLSRGFFNQNVRENDSYPKEGKYKWKMPDPPSPMQLSLLLRGVGSWVVYPAVFFLDMALLFDITVFRRLNSRELWDTDIKAVPNIIAANSYLPTPWSKLAIKLYTDQKDDVVSRIRNYNEVRFNGIPPLAELYVLSLEQLASDTAAL